jgi:AcrR family transcriptional regulator
MSEYSKARERTISKIESAYWNLFLKNEKITIKKVIEIAKIHKSTFYFYFDSLADVLVSIKTRQINSLLEILNNKSRENNDFDVVTKKLRNLFLSNKKYLVPLVVEQRGGEFSFEYREILKRKFAKDIGLECEMENQVKDVISNCTLNAMIELLIGSIANEIIPLEDVYKIGFGVMEKGIRKTFKEDLFIKIN